MSGQNLGHSSASLDSGRREARGRPSDQDIVDAYEYMLARWMVLRQEGRDFSEGFQWNRIVHRAPGGVAWANPNLDVAYSEAWIAVDETSCTLLELPQFEGRYYTFELLNGWAEVTLNINERNFPDHPYGLFALCLKGSKPDLPSGAYRIDLPNRQSRLLMRVELGADRDTAIALQKATTLRPTGTPRTSDPPRVEFDRFPRVEAFDGTEEMLAEADINPGMAPLQAKARAVAAAARDPSEREEIAKVLADKAIPHFLASFTNGCKEENGWTRLRVAGNYGRDYQMRSLAQFLGIWANNAKEVVYFGRQDEDGNETCSMTFPAAELPDRHVRYFWSVIVVDSEEYKVIPNPLDRFLLNKQSGLQQNTDGSLTLWFAPERPAESPEANWLPTPRNGKYNLTFRFYGPDDDVGSGRYFPPPLVPRRSSLAH
jgi:hypothetical protein